MVTATEIDALLPQTQCTRCGYPACLEYAEALAAGAAELNQCPPGGTGTITALAKLLGRAALPLNPANGTEGPALVAHIDEDACIGCAKCLPPCPVDAIVGAQKQMHTVLLSLCTGCELCVAPCPVDCISMVARSELADAPPEPSAADNRARYAARNARIERRHRERLELLAARKQAAGALPLRESLTMHASTRRAIYRRLQAANPAPTTELHYSSPFELLVAVMLSAHTTDRSVNAATRSLFPIANTPAAIAALGVEGVKPYIKAVGLYNNKSKNLVGLAQQLLERHGGEVPAERAALEALPGVGRKTASIVLNMVFGQVEVAVDTHIFRVANRTGLAPGKTPLEVEVALRANTPPEFLKDAHHWLLLHGRYVCIARAPHCPTCLIRDLCEYQHKTPAPKPRAAGSRAPHPMSPRPRRLTRNRTATGARTRTTRSPRPPRAGAPR